MNFTVQLTGSQQFGGQRSTFNSQLGTIQLHPSNDGLFVIGSLNTSMGSSGNALFSGMAMQPVQVQCLLAAVTVTDNLAVRIWSVGMRMSITINALLFGVALQRLKSDIIHQCIGGAHHPHACVSVLLTSHKLRMSNQACPVERYNTPDLLW
jgi:hypothetical protein